MTKVELNIMYINIGANSDSDRIMNRKLQRLTVSYKPFK